VFVCVRPNNRSELLYRSQTTLQQYIRGGSVLAEYSPFPLSLQDQVSLYQVPPVTLPRDPPATEAQIQSQELDYGANKTERIPLYIVLPRLYFPLNCPKNMHLFGDILALP
jgi:hypothetical protein